MRKPIVALAAALLVVVAVMLSGCSSWFQSPSRPANDAIGIANDHLKKASSSETSAAAQAALVQKVPYTKEGAQEGRRLTKSILSALEIERDELIAAKAAIDGIATLQVEQPLREYATLESASIDARIAVADAKTRLYMAFERLYRSLAGTIRGVDAQETIIAIQLMQQEVVSLAETAAAAAKTATGFFSTNRLGG